MILSIGEILFDLFPDRRVLGGAPFNVFAHLRGLGLPAGFVSRIGEDDNGKKIEALLKQMGLFSDLIQKDPEKATGTVDVTVDEKGVPDFSITRDVAYDYLSFDKKVESLLGADTRLICFGTLILRNRASERAVARIMEQRSPLVTVFCDLNLRRGCWNEASIRSSLSWCDLLKINEDEEKILRTIIDGPEEEEAYIRFLMDCFKLEWVSLTRGDAGSRLYDGNGVYSPGRRTAVNVADTVGAGDGYSSILIAGYLLKWQPALIVRRADEFAGALCEVKGAVPSDTHFYEKYSDWIGKKEI